MPHADAPDTAPQVLAHPVVAVDDDETFLRLLCANLEESGLSVRAFAAGSGALAYFAEGGTAAAVLLDWDMPEMDGPSLLQRLRAAGVTAPVLFLTGLSRPMFEEAALSGGAVDFVDKSRSFSIVLRRLQIALSGAKGALGLAAVEGPALIEPADMEPGAIEPGASGLARGEPRTPDAGGGAGGLPRPGRLPPLGALVLDLDSARARWHGAEVPLTLTEFHVVRLLASRAGRDVSYREIYDAVKGPGFQAGTGSDGYRTNVRALVKRVRQKFRSLDPDFAALQTYSGFGYRWSVPDEPAD